MKFSLSNYSIKKQLIVLVVAMGIIITFTGFLYTTITIAQHEKERFMSESTMEAQLIADFSKSPLAFYDAQGAMENMQILSSHKSIEHVVIYDAKREFFAEYNPAHHKKPTSHEYKNGFVKDLWFVHNAVYHLYIPIVYKNDTLGYLYMQKNASEIFDYSVKALVMMGFFSLILMIAILLIAIRVARVILRPVLSLAETTQQVARDRNFATRAKYKGSNEVAQLYSAVNLLLEETQNLTDGLENRVEQRTKELRESLEHLKIAQTQLIESEKMASLGNLVSGVAHEVNTPLGNALTGGSIIVRESQLIQKSLADGSLKRSVMDEKLAIIVQSATLMLKSLNNAADLIRSFKRISVDQSTNDLRDFDLRHYIEEVIQTYHNKLKQSKVDIQIKSPDSLMIYSYPGLFAQIFNNFINNALLHAFEGMIGEAKITIELQQGAEYLLVRFNDNGIGVDPKIQNTVFEPFVTTKRNAGGTGLGMNIIYNIITQKLGGSIQMTSTVGMGTMFEIHLPYITKKSDNGVGNVA